MKLRWWKTADEMAEAFIATRQPQSDEAFVASCNLPPTAYARKVALAVRNSVASYGMVDTQFIRADDSYPKELSLLSGWDSIDFVGWILELERELGMIVPDKTWDPITHFGMQFSVRDLIQAILDQGELKQPNRQV
jgi:acyl carrier protein